MAFKWISASPGVRYREHGTRRHGKKPDRYWCVQYRRNGQTINEAIGWWSQGASQAQAEELLSQLRRNWRTGDGPQSLKEMREKGQAEREAVAAEHALEESRSITLTEFWEKIYLPLANSRKTPDTMKIENWQFRAWIMPLLGDTPIRDLNTTHVESLLSNMRKAGKANRTQVHLRGILNVIINAAIQEGFFEGINPCQRVKVKKKDNQRVRFFSAEEATQLLEVLKARSMQLHDEALLSLFCGLRAKEIFLLTWADVDFDNHQIFIRDPKNHKDRFAFMTSEVEAMLRLRSRGQRPSSYVFPKEDGGYQKSVSTIYRDVIKELGFNEGISDRRLKVVFHTLRHTFASWLVQDGTPLFTVSKLMGHSSIQMTMRYAHLAPDHLRQAAGRLEGKLGAR